MCKIADPTEKGVWWKDETKWVLYSPEDARKILRAKKNGDSNITLGSVKSVKYPSGKLYAIDLSPGGHEANQCKHWLLQRYQNHQFLPY